MPRILVVDDHPVILRGLRSILSDAFCDAVVDVAESPEKAMDQLQSAHWDVAIVDLNLPKRGGLDLIRSMKELRPKTPILIYSMYSEEQFGLRAIQAGADGYLPKDTPSEEIEKAVRTLLTGKQYIREGLAGVLVSVARGGIPQLMTLSDREEQVLRLLAGGKTPTQIAETLSLSSKSIATYRSRILEKLDLHSTAELIRYAIDHGYL